MGAWPLYNEWDASFILFTAVVALISVVVGSSCCLEVPPERSLLFHPLPYSTVKWDQTDAVAVMVSNLMFFVMLLRQRRVFQGSFYIVLI